MEMDMSQLPPLPPPPEWAYDDYADPAYATTDDYMEDAIDDDYGDGEEDEDA